jgi:hypothetical protein
MKNIKKWASVTVNNGDQKRLQKLHDRFRPAYKATAFFSELMDTYEKAHCPECLMPVTFKVCPCKSPERL